jgi:hypothetical protein
MREPEVKPDRIVFIDPCVICGKNLLVPGPKVSISVRYKNSSYAAASAHADCVRPLLSESARPMLDSDKLASDEPAA